MLKKSFKEYLQEKQFLTEGKGSHLIDSLMTKIRSISKDIKDIKEDSEIEDKAEAIAEVFAEKSPQVLSTIRNIINVASKDNIFLTDISDNNGGTLTPEQVIKAVSVVLSKLDGGIPKDVSEYFDACLGDDKVREKWTISRMGVTTVGKSKKEEDTDAEPAKRGRPSTKDDVETYGEENDDKTVDDDTVEKELKKAAIDKESKVKLVAFADKLDEDDDILSGFIGKVELTEAQIFELQYKEDIDKALLTHDKITRKGQLAKIVKLFKKANATSDAGIGLKKIYVFSQEAKDADKNPWVIIDGSEV